MENLPHEIISHIFSYVIKNNHYGINCHLITDIDYKAISRLVMTSRLFKAIVEGLMRQKLLAEFGPESAQDIDPIILYRALMARNHHSCGLDWHTGRYEYESIHAKMVMPDLVRCAFTPGICPCESYYRDKTSLIFSINAVHDMNYQLIFSRLSEASHLKVTIEMGNVISVDLSFILLHKNIKSLTISANFLYDVFIPANYQIKWLEIKNCWTFSAKYLKCFLGLEELIIYDRNGIFIYDELARLFPRAKVLIKHYETSAAIVPN